MLPTSDPFKTKILLAALPDVPFDGWTEALLERTTRRLGLADGAAVAAFPGGIRELVPYFSVWATDETLKKLNKMNLGALRTRERIAAGVRTRLEILQPHKQAVSAALAFMAPPPRSFLLARQVWQTADQLWRAAGDTATDYNHYTKRLLLSGVLTSTTLYWLNDTSKNHQQTWAFLERRIENILNIGQKMARFKKQK